MANEINKNTDRLKRPTYNEIIIALKDTHNLYVDAVKSNYLTHDITRVMGNESIFKKLNTDAVMDREFCDHLLGMFYKPDRDIYAACQPSVLYWMANKLYKIIKTQIHEITGVNITMINEQGEEHSFAYSSIKYGEVVTT